MTAVVLGAKELGFYLAAAPSSTGQRRGVPASSAAASCTIDGSDAAQQPAPGIWPVSSRSNDARRKKGKHYLARPTGCKKKKHAVQHRADVHRQRRRRTRQRDGKASSKCTEVDSHAQLHARSTKAPPTAGPSSFLDSCAVVLFAHGIVGRADLPIPVELFVVAAAIVLVVSFLALAAGWSRPRLERVPERPLLRIPLAVEVLLGALGVGAFAVTVYAGWRARTTSSDNLAPWAVYVAFWIGVPFATLLFGDVFRLLSPWRAIGRADRLGRGARRARRAAGAAALSGPARPLAGRRRHPRLHDLRAVLGGGEGPGAARRADARSTSAIQFVRDEPVRRRGVDAPRRRVRRLVRPARAAGAGRPAGRRPAGAAAAGGRGDAARGVAGTTALLLVGDRLDRRSTAPRRGRCSTTLVRISRTRSPASARRRASGSSSRSSSGCWSRSPSSARSGRSACSACRARACGCRGASSAAGSPTR